MEIRVLGPIEVLVDGRSIPLGGPRQRALLGMLVAHVPNFVTVDQLIEGIWGEGATAGSRSTVQTYVSNLRQVMGDVFAYTQGGYRLGVDEEAVDACRFISILELARSRVTTDPAQVVTTLRGGLSWWKGQPYADLVDVPGLEVEVRRLEEMRLEAVELRVEAELALGRHGTLIAELEALAEEHPLKERFRAQHMLALYRSGRQGEALRAYRRTEEYLAEELGVEPLPELRELELRILEQDESLLSGMSRAVTQRLAFLVTDIEGSTRLWDRHPEAMASALSLHDDVLAEAIRSSGGRIVKHTGDGVLAVFSDASSAVVAAENAQRQLASSGWGEVGTLRVRMGIDVGEAETRGNDFFGPPLNRASRLCAIAHGGQVLVSAAAQSEVMASAPPGLQIRHLGDIHLRGMATPERVAQLVFVGLPADFPPLRTDAESQLDQRPTALSLPGYEVREQIGEGGFGEVWRAYQPSVGREVAVKLISPELASEPSFIRRFEMEARTIARLAHPHIVPLIDFWRDADRAYLVLALLPGGSLDDFLDKGDLDRRTARRVLEQVGSALDHAHSLEVAHGDLKPANVLLDGSGNAYLSDFGIASRLFDPAVMSSISSAPRYRAPEQPVSGSSPLTDIFALGVLARDLLPGIEELEPVLARATATNPGDRFTSAAEFLSEVAAALGDEVSDTSWPVVSRNPYKGLRAFDEADAADFYGRGDLVAALQAAVSLHRFVTVVGPSGSGKSSVVRAGLLPALASGSVDSSDKWFHIVMTPGSAPMESLRQALSRLFPDKVTYGDPTQSSLAGWVDRALDGGELVLVVDQMEELYTLVDDREARNEFLEVLVGAVAGDHAKVRIIATLRADFYDRPLADERVGPLVRDGQVTVLPPSRDELVEMVVSPAQAVGLRWEPGLPHRIAEDVAHQSGPLPLLQYALTELVERRSGELLTASDYVRIGGVSGALAGRAESVYGNFSVARQEVARQVLLRLVTVDEESGDTRRRVRRSELQSLAYDRRDVDAVLDTLVAERLLLADRDPVTRGPTIEVAHEALIREWPRLQGWIDDQRESLILGRRFRAALADWEASGCHDDYLLTGSRLAPFSGWAESTALTPLERQYFDSSRARDAAVRVAGRRRRRTLTAILAGAATVATILGIVAVIQARRATSERDRAVVAESEAGEQAALARSRELASAAAASLDIDPVLAKLLAIAAIESGDDVSIDLQGTLRRAFDADRIIDEYTFPPEREVSFFFADLHPSLPRVVASGEWPPPSTYMEVYDLERDRVLWSFEVDDPSVVIERAVFSPDGSRVVAGLHRSTVGGADIATQPPLPLGAAFFDAETGEIVDHIPLHERCGGGVTALSANHVIVMYPTDPDFDCGALEGERLTLELVDLASKQRRILTRASPNPGAFLSEDGRYVAFTDEVDGNHHTVVEEVATGQRVLEFDAREHRGIQEGWPHALSADGSLLVAGSQPMAVWDISAGEVISTFGNHAGGGVPVFAPDGETVFSMGREGTLRQWLASRGTEVAQYLSVGTGGRPSVRADGIVLVADQAANMARLLSVGPLGDREPIETCGGFTLGQSLDLSDDRAILAEICPDGRWLSSLVDLELGQVVEEIPSRSQVHSISPDGDLVAVQEPGEPPPGVPEFEGEWVGSVWIRDVETGRRIVELEGMCSWGFNGPDEHCAVYPETPFLFWAWRMAWSPDATMVAGVNNGSGGASAAYVIVWETTGGRIIGEYACPHLVSGAIFSPDGSELIVSCSDGRVVSVDTDTWQANPERSSVLEPRIEGRESVGFVGYGRDGMTLVAVGGDAGGGVGELLWIDTETLEVSETRLRAFVGSPKSHAISPSGRRVAVGSSDGFVKIFDTDSRILVNEFSVPGQVQGLGFRNDDLLLVAPEAGNLYAYTLDPEELVGLVRQSLTRGLTVLECERFGFGDDCPSLEELREG